MEKEWSIDWEWYDEMVREHDEMLRNYVESLLDFEDFTPIPEKKPVVVDKLLVELFSKCH